jgi:asparagine synthase (glutamine-hydrolysing)
MCGIAGIFRYEDPEGQGADQSALRKISAQMRSRGPDDEGFWVSHDGAVALAHRRLAIIDPGPAGHQPMRCRIGDHVIVFNGEIYNYQVLRKQLIEHGHRFNTDSDTEVLLRLYQHYGQSMLDHLRGMYAFAIWDPHLGGLFLVRDPYGIKPLYYANNNGELRFASQVKALFCGGEISSEKNVAAEAGFLLTGSVMEPNTLYREINCIPAGHLMWIDSSGPAQSRPFTDITRLFRDPNSATEHLPNRSSIVSDALKDSIAHHLVADVPVGTYLSAGIDSGTITSIAAELLDTKLEAVTLGFEEYRDSAQDETVLAAAIASSIGVRHHVRTVSYTEFAQDLDQILTAMDQPSIDGINAWFVSKAAAEQGLKVMLSGIGGDELFGGYPSFRDIPTWRTRYGWLSKHPIFARLAHYCASGFQILPISPKAFGMPKYAGSWGGGYLLRRGLFMPWELDQIMGADRAQEGLSKLEVPACFEPDEIDSNSYCAVAAMESRGYLRNQLLRDADWASMAHSVEVRTPLVDIKLTAESVPLISQNPGKQWMIGVPRKGLPESVVSRTKTGFTTPVGQWLLQSPQLDQWRNFRCVEGRHVHWSRRYALCLHQLFFS